MIKAIHKSSKKEFAITGYVYTRDEEWNLFISVSFLMEDWSTDSNQFPMNEETWEIMQSDYEIVYT